ncbi:glycoside hydrolase family 55 protein [Niallia sp. 01092]
MQNKQHSISTNNLAQEVNFNGAVFKVEDFGAKGDGTTDDSEAINDTIHAASKAGGGTIFFKKGTYLVTSTIFVPKNISIIGDGKTTTTLKRTDDAVESILKLEGDQTIQSIGLKSKLGTLLAGDNITILDCKFTNSIQGIQNSFTVHNLSVINSLFDGSGYGILSNQNPSYNVKIINCLFKNNTSDDIEINAESENWLIENCIFKDNKSKSENAGFAIGVAIKAKNITIKNCSFNNIAGQSVHVEASAEVTIMNSTFKNSGVHDYPGDPEADIAVLSNAKVTVLNSIFYESDMKYSKLAIYNTDLPVGGTVTVTSSKFYNKKVSDQVKVIDSEFIGDKNNK